MSGPSAIQASAGLRRLAGAGTVASTSAGWTITLSDTNSAATDLQRLQRSQANKRRRVELGGRDREGAGRLVGVGKGQQQYASQAPGSSATPTQLIDDLSNEGGFIFEARPATVCSQAGQGELARGLSSLSSLKSTTTAPPVRLTQPAHNTTSLVSRWRTCRAPLSLVLNQHSTTSLHSTHLHRNFSLFRSTPPANESAPQPQTCTPASPPPPTTNLSGLDSDRVPVAPSPSPRMDELNTLLRHPALYDPLMRPKNPLVLCHGLYGFDERGPSWFRLSYWNDLLKVLRGVIGAEVHVTAVPGMGSIKQRAHVLNESLERTPGLANRDINLLAHSMGGLDARYLLTKLRPTAYHPRALVTMSTPHRGSEFMSWCRANIGIGTDFDIASEEAARLLHMDDGAVPYSLKAPILSRAQVEAAKASSKAQEAAKEAKALLNFLPYSLSASVHGYLLDLLDSPAYANLTPAFLAEVFNPQTPDRDDVDYYSIAARVDKIPIWHPLWLCKTVLDSSAEARAAKGIYPADPNDYGNDGLVTVESAKWGKFLGTLENCDHWELRGGSGLTTAATAAKAVEHITQLDKVRKGWQWQDLYALVGASDEAKKTKPGDKSNESIARDKDGKVPPAEKVSDERATEANVDQPTEEQVRAAEAAAEDNNSLKQMAGWIVKHLPGVGGDGKEGVDKVKGKEDAKAKKLRDEARMMYGAPQGKSKKEEFNLERLTVAVCRKLAQDGH